jgi:hypothetical protein
MTAALLGRRNAIKAASERDLLLAYRTGAFAGLAFNGKLKSFDQYKPGGEVKTSHLDAIAFFHGQRAKGLPVQIERVPRVN